MFTICIYQDQKVNISLEKMMVFMQKIGQASVLSNKDWQKLQSVCDSNHHQIIWAICRYTAARIGEVLQLRVSDVYVDAKRGVLNDSIQFRRETRKGKDKNHTVPVCPQLRIILLNYRPTGYWLFPSPRDTTKHLSYEAALRYMKRKAVEAQLDHLKITTHCGRRSCITELARRGTDLRTIQAISGHASLTNLSRYIETDPARTKLALESVFT